MSDGTKERGGGYKGNKERKENYLGEEEGTDREARKENKRFFYLFFF